MNKEILVRKGGERVLHKKLTSSAEERAIAPPYFEQVPVGETPLSVRYAKGRWSVACSLAPRSLGFGPFFDAGYLRRLDDQSVRSADARTLQNLESAFK
jgi:hypothetical protein